jgi:hypothetical protein
MSQCTERVNAPPAPQERQDERRRPKPKRRWCRLIQPPTEAKPVGLLELQVGDEPAARYLLEREPNEFGFAAFVLHKTELREVEGSPGQFQSANGEPRHVLLDGQASFCTCQGFEKHGMCRDGKGCRHIAALAALVTARLL